MIMPLQPPAPPGGASQSKRRLVLVVDDSTTIRQEVAAALEPEGFTVLAAADGLEGLTMLAGNLISLVLLDVSMPRLGGLEMLERMKNDPAMANLPVLMLTAEAQESEIERARRLGAKGWMIKPIRRQQLVSIANKLCLDV
jgi:two-component system, chemotaxis family, chemotaxis protein CheY